MSAKKRSKEYWHKRFEQLESSSHAYGQQVYSQIEPAFTKAERAIQAEIESWYARFALNNGVTMQEARRMLTSRELAELRWDVQEYIKYGQQNAIDGKWMKQLENASARFHISRLEALKIRTQQALEVAFGNELDGVDKMARQILTEDYYKTIFEVQKGFNIGWEIGQVNQRELDKLVTKPWSTDGKNFSNRIWERKQQMVNQLHQELTRTAIQGKAPDAAIKQMTQFVSGKVKNAKAAASRLVMTEQAYFHSISQQEAFKDLDVEEFEIIATLDSHTSEICQDMDGQHFSMSAYEVGVTAPPFHPNCRSVTAPYFEDNYGGERAARGADGKTYYVPDTMTYKEWKQSMVDGNTDQLKPAAPDAKIEEPKEVHWTDMQQGEDFDTKKDAFKHFEDAGIKMSDSKKYPMDESLAKACAKWHSKFTKNFDVFDQNILNKLPTIRNVAPSSLPYGTLGQFSYYTMGKVDCIKLNSGLFSTYDYARKTAESSALSGWHSGKSPLHTFIHEYGHYVSHSMEGYEKGFEHKIIQEAIEEYKKAHSDYTYTTYIGLKDALSKYGTTNEAECFAEAFAEYFGEDEPREFATIFGHLLEKAMKGVKKP